MPMKYHIAEKPYSYSKAVNTKIMAPVFVALIVDMPEKMPSFLSEIKKLLLDCFREAKYPIKMTDNMYAPIMKKSIVVNIKLMKKFLLPFFDKSFSFSPKNPFQILCERRVSRRELTSANLHFPNWRWGGDSNSRYPFGYSSFQDCRLKPLGHPTITFSNQDTITRMNLS